MGTKSRKNIWKRLIGRARWVLEELREDSVLANPQKPVDCCNPPVSHGTHRKPETTNPG